jgi:hypothetical protein
MIPRGNYFYISALTNGYLKDRFISDYGKVFVPVPAPVPVPDPDNI